MPSERTARVELASRLEQVAASPLSLNQGTLYPALVRLEHKGWIKGTWQRARRSRRDAPLDRRLSRRPSDGSPYEGLYVHIETAGSPRR